MATLHPQECFLLERFVSLDYIGELRDAWQQVVDAHEQALERYMKRASATLRSSPLSEQADVTWGTVLLPNYRATLQNLMNTYIERSHGDANVFRGGGGVCGALRGGREYWHGWMDQDELERIGDLESRASRLDINFNRTCEGRWEEGDLSFRYDELNWGPLDLPPAIPAYELDGSVVVRPGDKVEIPGVYLPDVDHACAQFLHPYRTNQLKPDLLHARGMGEISVHQGLQRDVYGDWERERQVVPTWTLVRRTGKSLLPVPPTGLYP